MSKRRSFFKRWEREEMVREHREKSPVDITDWAAMVRREWEETKRKEAEKENTK